MIAYICDRCGLHAPTNMEVDTPNGWGWLPIPPDGSLVPMTLCDGCIVDMGRWVESGPETDADKAETTEDAIESQRVDPIEHTYTEDIAMLLESRNLAMSIVERLLGTVESDWSLVTKVPDWQAEGWGALVAFAGCTCDEPSGCTCCDSVNLSADEGALLHRWFYEQRQGVPE